MGLTLNVLQGFRTHPYLDVLKVCIFMVTGGNTEIIAETETVIFMSSCHIFMSKQLSFTNATMPISSRLFHFSLKKFMSS